MLKNSITIKEIKNILDKTINEVYGSMKNNFANHAKGTHRFDYFSQKIKSEFSKNLHKELKKEDMCGLPIITAKELLQRE